MALLEYIYNINNCNTLILGQRKGEEVEIYWSKVAISYQDYIIINLKVNKIKCML